MKATYRLLSSKPVLLNAPSNNPKAHVYERPPPRSYKFAAVVTAGEKVKVE